MCWKGYGTCWYGIATKSATYCTLFIHQKQGVIGFFVVFSRFLSCGFCWKCFTQELWRLCWLPPPSSLPGELSMDKRDSNGFFSTQKTCMVNHRSNKMTSSSLIVAHRQVSFLDLHVCQNCQHADMAYMYMYMYVILLHTVHYKIACNMHSCGYSFGFWLRTTQCIHLCRGFRAIVLHFIQNSLGHSNSLPHPLADYA